MPESASTSTSTSTSLCRAARDGEALGAEVFARLAAHFPEHSEELLAAEQIERAMLGLLDRRLERLHAPIDGSGAERVAAAATSYVARLAGRTWTEVADELLRWTAGALGGYARLISDRSDEAWLADVRTFLAHEAALVLWCRETATMGGASALGCLQSFIASL